MSVVEWLVAAGSLVIGVAGLARMSRIWHGRQGLSEKAPAAWPYGEAGWRAFRRLVIVGIAFAFVALLVITSDNVEFAEPLEAMLNLVATILAFLVLVIIFTVVLFNCPKWIVPPYMRREPGLIAAWVSS